MVTYSSSDPLNSVVLQTSWPRRPGCPRRRWTAGFQSVEDLGTTWRRLYSPWHQRTQTIGATVQERCWMGLHIESRMGKRCAPLYTFLPSPPLPPPPPRLLRCLQPPLLTHQPSPRQRHLPYSLRLPPLLPTRPSFLPPRAPSPSPAAPSACSER